MTRSAAATFVHELDELRRALDAARESLPASIERASSCLRAAVVAGRTVLACGNGGSASSSQHFVAELVGRLRVDRAPIAAVSLAADVATLTAVANDAGFERVFARQVDALARPGDVLVALSTSGRSPDVVAAARAARARGCAVVALTGPGGGDLAALADVLVAVPTETVARIQEVHALCLHAMASALEGDLATEPPRP